jgi:outer membrane beta-barrel protein
MIRKYLFACNRRGRFESQHLLKLARLTAPVVCTFALLLAQPAFADDIENLFKEEIPEPATAATPAPVQDKQPEKPNVEVKGVADLGKLESFEDVAVIQKRFLPRTGRFEFFLGPSIILNDAFFLNFGGQGRFAYYFTERYGLEAVGTYLSINERQVTTDLREKRGVITKSFVTPQTYMGLDFKWSPIYGKQTWMNKRIIPFDLYFSFGAGITGTNQNSSEPTLHVGTGQVFAQSKGFAWRWDFSWHTFQAKSNVTAATSTTASIYHNMLLSFGASFYFPEASYR